MNDGVLSLVGGTRLFEDGLPPAAPLFIPSPDATHTDDVLLDSWLASLTPNRFGRILDWLARPLSTGVACTG